MRSGLAYEAALVERSQEIVAAKAVIEGRIRLAQIGVVRVKPGRQYAAPPASATESRLWGVGGWI